MQCMAYVHVRIARLGRAGRCMDQIWSVRQGLAGWGVDQIWSAKLDSAALAFTVTLLALLLFHVAFTLI